MSFLTFSFVPNTNAVTLSASLFMNIFGNDFEFWKIFELVEDQQNSVTPSENVDQAESFQYF